MAATPLPDLLAVLDLEPGAPGHFRGRNLSAAGGGKVVYGGQLLAQAVVAASRAVPGKDVKSLHAVFVTGAEPVRPMDLSVEVMHAGRSFASATVDAGQEGRLCMRALVLLDSAGEELARHADPMPAVDGPELAVPSAGAGAVEEVRIVGGVDLSTPDVTGPAELFAWVRFPGAPDDDALDRALLAYASEPLFFGTALRPHAGLGQAMVYTELVPAVVTHHLTYHDRLRASEWFLLALSSPHVGRGRIFGSGSVFTGDGRLVASVTQENQLRRMPRRA